ncbi:gliding motility lipoprotein GldB [Alkaliflexus imshenetskii]|uniref:gliding motility lipoprotein GldB n=1 Tax=Alkaliflexus imshenetskii TaxID=286730 RepID=UPI0004B8163E|nr:gliding motility protein GldB [Alkaliflexus imshenetskii]
MYSVKKFFPLIFLVLVVLASSCSREPRPPKVNHIDVDFDLIPFYNDLLSIHPDSFASEVERLKSTYGDYLYAYSMGVIGAGSPDSEDFVSNMGKFLAYEPNQEVLDSVRLVFADTDALKRELEGAFRYYRHYYPERVVPDVYMHISGFNQSVVVDSAWVSVSVEKYLGSECVFYEWLSIPVYLRRRMSPEKVVPDIMRAIAMSEYAFNDSVNDVMNHMLYNGKLLYFVKQMMPSINDTLLFDYSKEQMAWVRHYEKTMWSTMVERKHLFSTDRMTITRYTGESPFTFFFGQESPGRTGHYIGYRIVQSFMRRNPEVTLPELMKMDNGHELFRAARYRP